MQKKEQSFQKLFNTYRLHAGIDSLSALGKLLEEKHLSYDESIFSKWKRGERVPRNRHVVITLMKIFIERKAILSLEEANKLLYAADLREMTEDETEMFKKLLEKVSPFFVPDEIYPRIIRDKYLKEISWKALNYSHIIAFGMPGSGKTALATTAAHLLRDSFPQGVYWFQCLGKSLDAILDTIGATFEKNIT